MPATTPNVPLPYPLPTEPVAEGAAAIRSLAEAVDNQLKRRWARMTGGNHVVQPGLWILLVGAGVWVGRIRHRQYGRRRRRPWAANRSNARNVCRERLSRYRLDRGRLPSLYVDNPRPALAIEPRAVHRAGRTGRDQLCRLGWHGRPAARGWRHLSRRRAATTSKPAFSTIWAPTES